MNYFCASSKKCSSINYYAPLCIFIKFIRFIKYKKNQKKNGKIANKAMKLINPVFDLHCFVLEQIFQRITRDIQKYGVISRKWFLTHVAVYLTHPEDIEVSILLLKSD